MQDEVVILEGARTPMAEWVGSKTGAGKRGGALASLSVVDLGALATKEALRRAGVAPEEVDHLMLGNAVIRFMPPGMSRSMRVVQSTHRR